MKSTLEDFREKLFKKGAQCNGKETEEMNSIIEFMKEDEGLNNQIMANATKTIKTIQPSILFSDFTIAMSMIQAVVANAMYYLEENGYLKIKKKEVRSSGE